MVYIVASILGIAAAALLAAFHVKRATVFEYERGLKYVNGKFRGVLEPGQYWHVPFFTRIETLDVRPRFVSISGQEVLSADGVALKVSLAASFRIEDPAVAINSVQSFQDALYLELQLALRGIIGAADVDSILSGRSQMARQLHEMTAAKAADLGLRLIMVNLKDIMFPGALKEVFAQVVNARKEGLAALEKARGETAALRNMANAAKVLESHPSLMQLRLVQALGETRGNTLIMGLPPGIMPVARGRGQGRGIDED